MGSSSSGKRKLSSLLLILYIALSLFHLFLTAGSCEDAVPYGVEGLGLVIPGTLVKHLITMIRVE